MPPAPPVSSGSGLVSRWSWWTGWSPGRSWSWWDWCPPPSPRWLKRVMSLSPVSNSRLLNPTRSRPLWTQNKVDHFSLFMLDVIIIDDDVVYIFYIVYVQYRPLYSYYLLSGLQTPLLMTTSFFAPLNANTFLNFNIWGLERDKWVIGIHHCTIMFPGGRKYFLVEAKEEAYARDHINL